MTAEKGEGKSDAKNKPAAAPRKARAEGLNAAAKKSGSAVKKPARRAPANKPAKRARAAGAAAAPLSAFYKSGSPALFELYAQTGRRRSWTFQAADRKIGLALARETDHDLSKTRRLLFEAIQAEESRYSHVAADFALEVAADDLAELTLLPPGEGVVPADALRELADSLEISSLEGTKRRRAVNLLMMIVDVLYVKTAIDVDEALPIILGAVGSPPKPARGPRNIRRNRIATLTDPVNGQRRIQSLVELVEPWHDQVVNLRRSASAAESAAASALQDLDAAQTEIEELRSELRSAASKLTDALDRVAQLTADLKNSQVRANVDDDALRKRVSVFMNSRLKDLITTAREASEVEPARSATTVRLLAQAIDELDKEIAWLRSSG